MNQTKNFNITITKQDDVVVSTKTKDWKMSFSSVSNHGLILKFFIENNTEEEVNELLTEIYYTSCSVFTNMEFAKHVRAFFNDKIEEAQILQEVSEKEDKENIKIVKDDTTQNT